MKEGELKYPDYNADICYMYLSEDEKLEVQVAYWEKEGGSWSVSFQPFDSRDLNFLVTK